MSTPKNSEAPVLDAHGNPVPVSPAIEINDTYRLFMSGRVPADCGHYMNARERSAGFKTCERC